MLLWFKVKIVIDLNISQMHEYCIPFYIRGDMGTDDLFDNISE